MVVLFLAQNIEITKCFFIKTALLKNKIIISFVKLVHKSFISWNKQSSLEYTFKRLISWSKFWSTSGLSEARTHWTERLISCQKDRVWLSRQTVVMLNFVWTNHVLEIVLVLLYSEWKLNKTHASLSNSMQFWPNDLCKLGKEYLTAQICKLRISFWTKFWNFWHIVRLSIISRCKVIWSQKQSVFWPTLHVIHTSTLMTVFTVRVGEHNFIVLTNNISKYDKVMLYVSILYLHTYIRGPCAAWTPPTGKNIVLEASTLPHLIVFFNFNFLAPVVSEIIWGSQICIKGPCVPRTRPSGKHLAHPIAPSTCLYL